MNDRRRFLQAAAGTLAAGASGMMSGADAIHAADEIRKRKLGSTGLEVSEVSFGAMNCRDQELIEAAIDIGINYIDTAHIYQMGRNEEMVGRAVRGKRDKVIIATKVWTFGTTQGWLRGKMEKSLERLNTDYVDIMFKHMAHGHDAVFDESDIEVFGKAKEDGLCRFTGVSIHSNHVESVNAARESGFWNAVLVGYNYESPPELTEAIAQARAAGLAVIAMKTQRGGDGYAYGPTGDMTPNQAALRYVLDNPNIDCAIPGMTTFEQLEENLAAMQMGADTGRHFAPEPNRSAERSLHNTYCRGVAGCTGCDGQCSHDGSIRDLNRCIGYADSYGDIETAREQIMHTGPLRATRCLACDECEVACVHGLPLTQHLQRAKELFL